MDPVAVSRGSVPSVGTSVWTNRSQTVGNGFPLLTGSEKGGTDRTIQQQVQRLKAQEEKVRAHEAAHKAAGGQYAKGVSYTYAPGPDGRSYIVGGEVQIDISPGRTPRETIRKMEIVQRAALAPADPSGQDRAVAAQAAALAARAQQELARGEGEDATSGGRAGSLEPDRTEGNSSIESGTSSTRRREAVDRYRLMEAIAAAIRPLLSVYA